MRLGLNVQYSGREFQLPVDAVLEAERLGFDSVWTAEAWGSDAVTPLAWLGAAAAVPDELVDGVALCGPKARIAERLERWEKSRVTTLCVGSDQVETMRLMAEIAL